MDFVWFEETIPFRRNISTTNHKLSAFTVFYGVAICGVSLSCSIIAHLESLARMMRNGFYLMCRRE
jgi:hypothetical protein